MPIGVRTPRQALVAMCSENVVDAEDKAAVALDIQYAVDEEGNYDFSQPIGMEPVKWDEWVKLPVLPYHECVRTSHSVIRLPQVIIARHFNKIPFKKFRPSKRSIFQRDGGICQYSGKPIPYSKGNLDHVKARALGGKDSFDNLVWSDPDINFKKGCKTLKESGLSLLRTPKEPLPVPVSALIENTYNIRDWDWFLK